jgi:anti-sigma B factor antagonist
VLEVSVPEEGKVVLAGRFDASQKDKAQDVLESMSGSFVVDLSGLEYISSAGIGVLAATLKRLHASGETLTLVNPSERVRSVLQLTGLDRVFPIR